MPSQRPLTPTPYVDSDEEENETVAGCLDSIWKEVVIGDDQFCVDF